MPEDSRISRIDKLQQALEQKVSKMQGRLLELLQDALESIYKDPENFERLFKVFTSKHHLPVITQFGNDLIQIGELNSDYFAELTELSANAFNPIKREVGKTMLTRFGLTKEGKLMEGGFLDSFIKDTSVKREIKQYMYKAKTSGVGLDEFSKGLRRMITDSEESSGLLTRFYKTYAYDTYTEADRTIQKSFADRLGLTAFIYAGGLIRDSRPFCKERNGKVFIFSEGKEWEKLEFAGKGKNYVWTMLGHYGCRHSLNVITDQMAMRRRDDLEIVSGKLQVKK